MPHPTSRPGAGPMLLLCLLLCLLLPSTASSRPEAPARLCALMPDIGDCQGDLPTCDTCHTSTAPVAWNAYGRALLTAWTGDDFAARLEHAVAATGDGDADADGYTNLVELRAGTAPGDADQRPPLCTVDPRGPYVGLDLERAFVRVHVLYCGRSPDFEARQAFAAEPDRYAALHAALDRCLGGAYWRDEGLHRIADPLVQPVSTFGHASPIGAVLADYRWDYRLFAYAMTGGRDLRALLQADYHVEQAADGALVPVQGVIEPDVRTTLGVRGGQLLEPAHRAGMVTSQWFIVYNTLISDLPRTTAARAYRAFLGHDIAELQGIYPVPGEPVDVDDKGVAAPECAVCHSTLDPLSYAFARYEGLVQPGGGGAQGVFAPDRPSTRMPGWSDPPAVLFGEPVDGLTGWAAAAASSDAFARHVATLLFRHAFDRAPMAHERPAFDAIWRRLPEDGWSADRLIHRLIDLPAFGGLR